MELLIKKAQKGNKETFVKLFDMIQTKFYIIAKARLRNDEDAKDAIQDTFITIYRKLNKLRKIEKFNAWSTKILINNCNNILRKNKNYISYDN